MARKKIALIAPDCNQGLIYQRGHHVLRKLQKECDEYEFVALSLHELDHKTMLYLDGAIFFRPSSDDELRLIHRTRFHYQIPVIIDVDDLLTNLPTDHKSYSAFQGVKTEAIIGLANHVVCSTNYLYRHWSHLNRNMSVIENTFEPDRYAGYVNGVKPYHSGFCVGWSGSSFHLPDIYHVLLEPLTEFMRRHDDVRFYAHGLCAQSLVDEFGVRCIFNHQFVDYMDYPGMTFTYPIDVMTVPLYDHPFNDAKSDLRLLDMGAISIPVIASPAHEFERHKDKGYALITKDNSPEAWLEKLEWAHANRSELQDVGTRARQYVYNYRINDRSVKEWKQVLDVVTDG